MDIVETKESVDIREISAVRDFQVFQALKAIRDIVAAKALQGIPVSPVILDSKVSRAIVEHWEFQALLDTLVYQDSPELKVSVVIADMKGFPDTLDLRVRVDIVEPKVYQAIQERRE